MAARLITIPFSHFCEKARWSLDLAGVAYREEGHLPLVHRLPVRRAGGRQSVPVLAFEDGTALGDSSRILRFADAAAPPEHKLFPADGRMRDEALGFERHLDVDFAPHVRRFAYFHILPSRETTFRLFERQTPRHEQVLVGAIFPLLRAMMRRFMTIDERHALASRDALRRVFDDVGRRIEGRRYLFGERLGVADVTFAAFAAPLLLPPEHPVTSALFEHLDSFAPPFADEVRALRRSPAGVFALRLYREHRTTVARTRLSA
ncbi:MAG: glutathione S-transferase [Myxococcota bacterium]|nr:glutathione S-transferase [Myxococcota bacterium]